MIVTFFDHAQILRREEIEKWLYVVTENLIEQGAITFFWAVMVRLTAWQHPF